MLQLARPQVEIMVDKTPKQGRKSTLGEKLAHFRKTSIQPNGETGYELVQVAVLSEKLAARYPEIFDPVSAQYIGDIERGRSVPGISRLAVLAVIYGLDRNALWDLVMGDVGELRRRYYHFTLERMPEDPDDLAFYQKALQLMVDGQNRRKGMDNKQQPTQLADKDYTKEAIAFIQAEQLRELEAKKQAQPQLIAPTKADSKN